MPFSTLSLHSHLLHQLPAAIVAPTDIQKQAIPVILNGKDLLALAQTGSGKTLAFGLPILHKIKQQLADGVNVTTGNAISAVIIVPTRELASQVTTNLSPLATGLNIKIEMLCGGEDINLQTARLHQTPNIVVATPGRLLALAQQGLVNFLQLNTLVLDEADRLLDMGFIADINALIALMPVRQTLLFSATMPAALEKLAALILSDSAKRIEANALNRTVSDIEQQVYHVNKGCKAKVLKHLISQTNWTQVLVFVNAKADADSLCKKLLKAGVAAAALHGDKEQTSRSQTLADFKCGKVNVLIATDVLARGIHIDALPVVINFELPPQAAVYVHRIGRTARAGLSGQAISLVSHQELEQLSAIALFIQQDLTVQYLSDFPVTDKPRNSDSKRPARDKQANRRTATKKTNKAFAKRTANSKRT